jgi:ATP-binding cassette subfamily B protein
VNLIGLEIVTVMVGELLARASGVVDAILTDLFTIRISIRLIDHAARLDLSQLEDPTVSDQLERARRQTNGRIGLIAQFLGITQSAITLASLAVVLFKFNSWLLLLLILAAVPGFLGEAHFAKLQYSMMFAWTQRRRELEYLRLLGSSNETAKEVQLFGLGSWLSSRYQRLSTIWHREKRRLAVNQAIVGSVLSLVSTVGYYSAYVVIVSQTVKGILTLGTMTLLAATFGRGRDLIQGVLSSLSLIYDESLYVRDLFEFLQLKPNIDTRREAIPVSVPIRQGFVFEDVGFRYPNSDRWAVRHINLWLNPGKRVALVGENGAGKTTITKLLARLYDPTEGRILLDGHDLRAYDLTSLRRTIGVIFQDFVQYDFRFDENIGVGEIDLVGTYLDRPIEPSKMGEKRTHRTRAVYPKLKTHHLDFSFGSWRSRIARRTKVRKMADESRTEDDEVPGALREASEKSLATGILPRLPLKWIQMLGRRFDGGIDLSGGEWQKIALARAYMRKAEVIILDEPTAALDSRSEFEVFQRFSDLTVGRMALIVSHRFSTVRMADWIVVLKNGRVVEEGSHETLLGKPGLYSELFELQAAAYR